MYWLNSIKPGMYIRGVWKMYDINTGNAVAQLFEALRYGPGGRGFDFPILSLEFCVGKILPAALWF